MSTAWLDKLKLAGQLQNWLSNYELRPHQLTMAHSLGRMIEEGKIALAEAPTGTGKTLAYLLPALDWVIEHGGRVLISTYTLPLQEQILKRDLPLASSLLGRTLSTAMLKGMGNYLCLQKAHSFLSLPLLEPEKGKDHRDLDRWIREAKEGNRSEGPPFSPLVWQEISAGEECTRQRCEHYNECFYFKHRRAALSAQVAVINHHLLASELKRRLSDGATIVGPWDILIIDEAHHLIDVMTRQLAIEVSEQSLAEPLARLWVASKQKSDSRGWLANVKDKLHAYFKGQGAQMSELERVWLDGVHSVDEQWRLLSEFVAHARQASYTLEDNSKALPPDWPSLDLWRSLASSLKRYVDHFKALIMNMEAVLSMIKEIEGEGSRFGGPTLQSEALMVIKALSRQLQELEELSLGFDPQQQIAWLECDRQGQWKLQLARFDLAASLRQVLWNQSRSALLCSATLGACQKFEPLLSELGFECKESEIAKRVEFLALASSFDWQRQSLLLGANNIPLPNEKGYSAALVHVVQELLMNCKGRCLLLTTSLEMVRYLMQQLSSRTKRLILAQGTSSREHLLEQFAKNEEALVIGADSFWEGIDLAGQPIKLVIMAKLPFDLPSDPLIKAKANALYGKRAFVDYLLPRAVLRFQQGMGRLLRHSGDRGCVICLDSRLWKARYGKQFLKASDPAKWQSVTIEELASQAAAFLSVEKSES